MQLEQVLDSLPETKHNVVSVLSGGLDSSVMTMVLVRKYGANKVFALSFDYRQKQRQELIKAAALCAELGVKHQTLDLSVLGDIAAPMSANIEGTAVAMPTIHDVLGDPAPPTYVPNRNMILYSLAASFAEVMKAEHIFCGLQVNDTYGYHDTTAAWVAKMNSVLDENRKIKIKISAPFVGLSKTDEINLAAQLGQQELLVNTLTCYNPNPHGLSCGICPSCAERIKAFKNNKMMDPVPYQKHIDWQL